jgi:hypothetical protein
MSNQQRRPDQANDARPARPAEPTTNADDTRSENLRDSPMMAHLLDALESGADIGHYGRLTFAMIAHYFLDHAELTRLLGGQPDQDEQAARALLHQVETKDYSPPKRDRILAWQAQQDFPICPTPDDPASCNVYRELRFPDEVYEHISEYYEQQVEHEAPQ